MYICPTCGCEFETEARIQAHFIKCWHEQHPNHISKEAPHSENIETRKISNEMEDFFKSLGVE